MPLMTGMAEQVDLLVEEPLWDGLEAFDLCERALHATLLHLNLSRSAFMISVLACDDARIEVLNGDFRGKAAPTNVLSWPSDERAAQVDGDRPDAPELPMDAELGDIAISYQTCAREAALQGKSMADHVTHLMVHGILHLLGFDHERDKDAALMEGVEVEILASLGLANPYENTDAQIAP